MEAKIGEDSISADVIAFVDEAGPRGFLRDLVPSSDAGLSVMCALPIPVGRVSRAREIIQPGYDAFCAAAPNGAKPHITDAFQLGNEAWGEVAARIRAELFAFMREAQLRVIYVARRLQVARETYEMNGSSREELKGAATASGPSWLVVPGADRPSSEQID